ncbi:DoxX family protein [Flavicella marina]|uniref:DoxX family protein n=1 Tax=Flavicella marina TaxID=1475951 RepID=UPI001265A950|nr:DoxX family protein [Flavicella marina]
MDLQHPYLAQLLILVFLLITFVISVIEKFSDWQGTISYISETFKNSFIKNFIKPLIAFLVFLEVLTAYFVIIGIYQLYVNQEKETALLGTTFSCITILYMLVGQRIAKDYPGATSLTVYFILSVFGVYLLN